MPNDLHHLDGTRRAGTPVLVPTAEATRGTRPTAAQTRGTHPTDIRVRDASTTFVPMTFTTPLTISGRAITSCDLAVVEAVVEDRRGRTAVGRGATVLSVPWSWPGAGPAHAVREESLRRLTEALAAASTHLDAADPLTHWQQLHDELGATARRAGTAPMPALAAMLALGAVDNALHDAWGRAAGRPVWEMYTGEHLGRDLAGLGLPGRFPGEFLRRPAATLPVQHVVGAQDLLVPDPLRPHERSLVEWIAEEGVHHLKIKTASLDPAEDARRIARTHALAAELVDDVRLTVDPNEGYADAHDAAAMLDHLQRLSPAAAAAVALIEQPTPRGRDAPAGLAELSARVPVLADEGFTDLAQLQTLRARGWSGLVVKAAKGQTPALLAHAYARAHGLFVTAQDLTAVDLALRHSARLAGALDLSATHLEYNSRQYVPAGNDELTRTDPALTTVKDGRVRLPAARAGLY
ncbi:enolase C-terminal domain-like protein [Georgenia subflava]|uniref:Mandelate racemase/muconate lactonizing enzyme C-terminal domain-containing protein n=1 Tax=Georgenia subflava TaxID=1622177 RepID=A0A6N7EDF1_9MICO|nr:enolase C-terminal domain-like protein [Georgenia subflava]MPV36452.1 hypothetical protein [Georgenia subflava]